MLSADLFRVLDCAADAAFAVDETGIIRYWNRAAERLFGYRTSAILNKPCAEVLRGRGPLGRPLCTESCSTLECALQGHPVSNFDMAVRNNKGSEVWINCSILLVDVVLKNDRLVVHLARDVTDQKRADEATKKLVDLAKQISLLAPGRAKLPPARELTQRERRVLQLFAEGRSSSDVAFELGVNLHTLRNHLHHANAKLGTHTRLEAIIHAKQRGLI